MPAHEWRRPPVRYSEELQGFELRCPDCERRGVAYFWPLTLEFWDPHTTMRRCRACNAAKKRADEKKRRQEKANAIHGAHRVYYWENREVLLMKQRARRALDPERERIRNRAYREAHREELNAKAREKRRRLKEAA